MSDDGANAVTVIAFVGSVFSPYYAWTGRKDPENHCALNVCLYGRGAGALGGSWSMTERGREQVSRSADRFRIGPSVVAWDGTALTVTVRETRVPQMTPLTGVIRVIPEALTAVEAVLDSAGAHVWRPFAPRARIEVAFSRPALTWSGEGYLDGNFGTRALEADFSYWTWSRAPHRDGAVTFYDAERRDGSVLDLGIRFGADGGAERVESPPKAALPRTLWRVRRETRADAGSAPRVARRMEDAPFYARATLDSTLWGERTAAVHEALDLDRFAAGWVKGLLPFRMPRPPCWPPGWLRR